MDKNIKETYGKNLGLFQSPYDPNQWKFKDAVPLSAFRIPDNYITESAYKFCFDQKDSSQCAASSYSYIRMLQEQGLSLGVPYIKHIDNEIWELRPLRDRILFAYHVENKFVLLSVFMKKTQKTPKKEIKKAKRYLEDYDMRSDNSE